MFFIYLVMMSTLFFVGVVESAGRIRLASTATSPENLLHRCPTVFNFGSLVVSSRPKGSSAVAELRVVENSSGAEIIESLEEHAVLLPPTIQRVPRLPLQITTDLGVGNSLPGHEGLQERRFPSFWGMKLTFDDCDSDDDEDKDVKNESSDSCAVSSPRSASREQGDTASDVLPAIKFFDAPSVGVTLIAPEELETRACSQEDSPQYRPTCSDALRPFAQKGFSARMRQRLEDQIVKNKSFADTLLQTIFNSALQNAVRMRVATLDPFAEEYEARLNEIFNEEKQRLAQIQHENTQALSSQEQQVGCKLSSAQGEKVQNLSYIPAFVSLMGAALVFASVQRIHHKWRGLQKAASLYRSASQIDFKSYLVKQFFGNVDPKEAQTYLKIIGVVLIFAGPAYAVYVGTEK